MEDFFATFKGAITFPLNIPPLIDRCLIIVNLKGDNKIMKLAKKLILSLSIAFTMCIALVIGFVLNSSPNPSNALGGGHYKI